MTANDVEAAARAAWLALADRAMAERWTDHESWLAAKATIADLGARFGRPGVDAFYALERKLYRLFAYSPGVEALERERRRERRAAPGLPWPAIAEAAGISEEQAREWRRILSEEQERERGDEAAPST